MIFMIYVCIHDITNNHLCLIISRFANMLVSKPHLNSEISSPKLEEKKNVSVRAVKVNDKKDFYILQYMKYRTQILT